MRNNNREYFFLDLDVISKKIVNWGISNTATLTGETGDKNVHRVFLTKGQYNKLIAHFEK